MTNERRVLVHLNKESLSASVAARFITKTVDILDDQDAANVVLTGGSVGIAVLAAINSSPARDTIDWGRVSFWWGDERWVPKGHPNRNELQAREALLDHISVPEQNVHPFPASDEGDDLEAAAARYAAELALAAPSGAALPRFDITFLGVGPDGHVASLFPHQSGIRESQASVIPILNAPKPPAERLSLTRPALNSSERVWLVLAGSDKASALGLALAGASRDEVPVAGIKGRKRTVFFVDSEAAAEVPENLIAPIY
ncbi:6-phosphogluconolactonase [Cryobacterium psychrotolerans]|uniref:6-phosphogluconolactonase n=1 Tax=Cryobacterium psychrotolerans TaxID=386301 RepID=A0A1G8ZSV0_9MICO|nr:6-phosphogluconolactonase [Cryobacterium psychrotolerans]TFD87476.1 6-phosphogluconolactonase [Cryobacterium psychrotolerans]SDK17200.1 6-phosphogluconolactonase [Cryobacterium psychrotolerans]